MAEWLKAHAWKVCKGAILSWVRIPFSPPKPNLICRKLDLNILILYYHLLKPNTWHGMEKKTIVKERRCIQVNYVTFETDWKVNS